MSSINLYLGQAQTATFGPDFLKGRDTGETRFVRRFS